jgi:PhnB protein
MIHPYLSFSGRCEAAFNFYKSIFGGEFDYLGKFKDMPAEQEVPDDMKELIMHVSLRLPDGTLIFGDDGNVFPGQQHIQGNNVHLSINAPSEDEAIRVFNALSANGTITMPLEKTFWGALFGRLNDQFGIRWMINFDYEQVS